MFRVWFFWGCYRKAVSEAKWGTFDEAGALILLLIIIIIMCRTQGIDHIYSRCADIKE